MTTNRKLTILIYGDFQWHCLASSYHRAFQRLGYEIIPFEVRRVNQFIPYWLHSRVGHRLTLRSLRLRRLGAKHWNEYFTDTVKKEKPELVFILNGDFLMPDTVATVRSWGIPVFIFHADNPFPPFPSRRPETLPCALECDCYFIWSKSLVKRLKGLGVKQVRYLPFAWDPEVHPCAGIEKISDYSYDVVFVGNWDKDREEWLEPLAKGFNLFIWGENYWKTRTRPGSPLRTCWQGKAVIGHEAVKILRKSRIALNVLRVHNLPDGTNMKNFELTGCGAFTLSTHTQGALEIFPEGEAGAYFNTPNELLEKISYYLPNDRERYEIRQNANEIVSNGHSYMKRAEHIISVLRNLK